MKFAHELLALQADCPAEFSGRFINYKQLKKIIKQIRDVEAAGGPDSPAEAQFLHLLNVEVAAVNRCHPMPRTSHDPR
jgi:SPX domain protein involved in polyphosphate accumulation